MPLPAQEGDELRYHGVRVLKALARVEALDLGRAVGMERPVSFVVARCESGAPLLAVENAPLAAHHCEEVGLDVAPAVRRADARPAVRDVPDARAVERLREADLGL